MSEQNYGQLASSSLTSTKTAYVLFAVLCIFLLFFFTANAPDARLTALSYLGLFVFALILVVMTFGIKKLKGYKNLSLPNVILHEKKTALGVIGRKQSIIMCSVVLIIGVFLFVYISGQSAYSIISAPQYSTLEVQGLNNILLTISSSAAEDFAFSAAMIPFIFVIAFYIISRFTKVKNAATIALVITLCLNPLIFASYHSLRYGFLTPASFSSLMFSVVTTIWVVTMRNIFLPLVLHASNNASLSFFSIMSIDISIYALFVVGIIVVLTAYLILKKSSRSGLQYG